jgi:hypothetical protein
MLKMIPSRSQVAFLGCLCWWISCAFAITTTTSSTSVGHLPVILKYKDISSYGSEDLAKTVLSALTDTFKRTGNHRRVQDGTNSNYVDFSKLLDPTYEFDENLDQDAAFYSMVGALIQQGKELINGNVTDNNGEPLVINSLMESFLGGDNNISPSSPLVFRWQLAEEGFTLDLPGINPVTLKALNVGGLDTFNMVSILNPTPGDPQTIQNEVGLDILTLELEIEEMTGDNGEKTMSTIGLSFIDVTISVPLYAAIDQTAMAELPVGALLQTQYMMPCLTGVVDALEISALDMTIGTIEPPTSSSATETPVFQVVQTVFVTLPGSVPAFFDAIIRPIFNNMVKDNLGMNDDALACPTSMNETESEVSTLIDFREFLDQGLPALLKSFVDSQILAIDPETGLSKVNDMLIRPMTLNQSGIEGTFIMGDPSSPLVDVNTRISVGGLQADIQLRVSDLQVQNLDTLVQPLALLETVESDPYLINNTATMGLELTDRPMSLSTRLYFSIETKGLSTQSTG